MFYMLIGRLLCLLLVAQPQISAFNSAFFAASQQFEWAFLST
jgi:hypothetical protein